MNALGRQDEKGQKKEAVIQQVRKDAAYGTF